MHSITYLIKFFLLNSFFFFILSNSLIANSESKIKLEWKIVSGSKGYLVQVKNTETSEIKDFLSQTNSTEISLPMGSYEIRVSGLNKFKKPDNFSNWKVLNVTNLASTQRLDLNSENKEPIVPNIQSLPIWQNFIPGLVPYKKDKKIRSYIYWSSFTILALGFWNEKISGDQIATNAQKQDTTIYLSSLVSPTIGPAIFYLSREELRNDYNQKQQNQVMVSGLAVLLYTFTVYDSFKLQSIEKKEGLNFQFSLQPTLNQSQLGQTGIESSFRLNYNF
ncbi:MAG: hypothetical protein SFU98_10730 [Leptospiraceae bacterium]|nr:hypothetical protein [Leptospiraceae bacterium]